MLYRLVLLLGLLVTAGSAHAQVIPSGSFTPGHTVRCQNSTCTVVVDAGGSAGSNKSGQGYLTELGITNTGTPLCINDALTNNSSGYHQFCFGANSLGGGLISYNAYGGASQLGLFLNINGSTYGFPGPGNGNVIGPNSSNANAIAFFNGTSGTIIKDDDWVDDGTELVAPSGRSFTTQGTGTFQVGGTTGPYMFNDTALDTISFQAKPGALPSGNATNVQIYPPVIGQEAWLNITKLANSSPDGEERLLLGTDGSSYLLTQVISGTGTCHNFIIEDGYDTNFGLSLFCGDGTHPSMVLGPNVALTSLCNGCSSSNILFQIDSTDHLLIGTGDDILANVINKPVITTGTAPTITSCGTSPSDAGATNIAGIIVIGGGTVTSCTVTFASPSNYTNTPAIVLTGQGTSTAVLSLSAASASGFTIAASADIHGQAVHYIVIQ